jgi:hypothetical protein
MGFIEFPNEREDAFVSYNKVLHTIGIGPGVEIATGRQDHQQKNYTYGHIYFHQELLHVDPNVSTPGFIGTRPHGMPPWLPIPNPLLYTNVVFHYRQISLLDKRQFQVEPPCLGRRSAGMALDIQ